MMFLFILEDITPGVQAQRDWETPGGIAPLAECMFMGQKLDIGVVIVSHTLSGLSPIIRQNVGTWLVTGLPGEDPRLVCNVLGMDSKQADKARTLQPGELVCSNPVLWPKPVYATFPTPAIPGTCGEAMRKSTVERFLKNVHTAPAAPISSFRPPVPVDIPSTDAAAQPKSAEFPARWLAFMVYVATSVPAAIMKMYERLGLGGVQGRRVTKGLADAGLIRIHCFSTGRKGGQVGLVEITDSGWELLKKKGLLPPKRRTSGDWEHETAAKLIEVEGARLGYRVSFEIPLGGIQADVQWLDPKTGHRILLNIGISRPAHEVETIERFLRLPTANETKFILVVRDTSFAGNVKVILKGRDPKGEILRRIEMKLITDFMNT